MTSAMASVVMENPRQIGSPGRPFGVISSLSTSTNKRNPPRSPRENRSKSYPSVRGRNGLRLPSSSTLRFSEAENVTPVSSPDVPELPGKQSAVLRKYSLSTTVMQSIWKTSLRKNRTDERKQSTDLSKSRRKLNLANVAKNLVLQSLSDDKKKLLNPLKIKEDIRKRKLYKKFQVVAKITVLSIRLTKAHSLRYRENDDEISPYIKGLTFHDYDNNQHSLMFDKSAYKAKKSIKIPEETRKILCKHPRNRTQQELYTALITLRNIKAFADYPNQMQEKIVAVGQYERYEAKRIVLRQGHPGSSYYFMLSGAAVVMVMDPQNSYARPIKHLEKGMDFGEIALSLNIKRKGTVITKEPCELMSIGRKDYQKIFMAGGIRSINDPDQEKFLKGLSFFEKWPIHLLEQADDKTHFLYFKRGDTIIKESGLSPWIVVVKSMTKSWRLLVRSDRVCSPQNETLKFEGSISVLKKLKRVEPFEWKKKKEVILVTEKEKKDNLTQREIFRRHALAELKIPIRNEVENEDIQYEEYPGKPKQFIHPGEEQTYDDEDDDSDSESNISRRDKFRGRKRKKDSFQCIQNQILNRNAEKLAVLHGKSRPTIQVVDSEEEDNSSADVIKPLKPLHNKTTSRHREKKSNRRESVLEKEREMMGFEEKKRTVQDDIDASVKDDDSSSELESITDYISDVESVIEARKSKDELTIADLKPEFVRVQIITKGEVFGLSDLILEQKTNFSIVSNGADVLLIDQQFYMKNAPEGLLSKLRQELCPYPTEEEMQTRLQQSVDWDAFKNSTMSHTLDLLEAKRTLKQSQKT